MKKSSFAMLFPWSAEYVITHAKWRKSKGRRPSMSYRGVRNPAKALVLAAMMSEDTQFEDVAVKEVSDDSFKREDGWSFGIQDEWGVKPRIGDAARFYGRGIGSTVRGLDINGVQCFYRTEEQQRVEHTRQSAEYEAEQKAEFEKNKASLDEKYQNLPEVFQRRIDKFRMNNPDFRWKYEAYEMFCCVQAVIIANTITGKLLTEGAMTQGASMEDTKKVIAERVPSVFQEFSDMSWKKQKEMVPDLDDGHSGNTLGCSKKLAYFYVSEHPENVVKLHGAMAPLVGSEEYGCVARA